MHRYRCSESQLGCGARFTLRRAPHQYARGPFCPSCGSIHVRSVERAAIAQTKRRKQRGAICRCANIPFPHVRATLRFCAEHPRITAPYTDAEWQSFLRVVETPRGSC